MSWPSVTIHYRFGKSFYRITVFQLTSTTISNWQIGVQEGEGDTITLIDDGLEHEVSIRIAVSGKENIPDRL